MCASRAILHTIPYDGGESTSIPPASPHRGTFSTTVTVPRRSIANRHSIRRLHMCANRKFSMSEQFEQAEPSYTPYHMMGREATSIPPAPPHQGTFSTTVTVPRRSIANRHSIRRLHMCANRKFSMSEQFEQAEPSYTPYHMMGREATSIPPAPPHQGTFSTTVTVPRRSIANRHSIRRLHMCANRKFSMSEQFEQAEPSYTPYHMMGREATSIPPAPPHQGTFSTTVTVPRRSIANRHSIRRLHMCANRKFSMSEQFEQAEPSYTPYHMMGREATSIPPAPPHQGTFSTTVTVPRRSIANRHSIRRLHMCANRKFSMSEQFEQAEPSYTPYHMMGGESTSIPPASPHQGTFSTTVTVPRRSIANRHSIRRLHMCAYRKLRMSEQFERLGPSYTS